MKTEEKKEIYRYIPVLIQLLIMMIVSLLTFERLYFSNQYFGELINIAGKQRMLSQRLVIESSDYLHDPSAANKERYQRYIQLMESDNAQINAMDLSTKERNYYEHTPALNDEVENYITQHKAFILHPGQERFNAIKLISKQLLRDLDSAVVLHQEQYEANLHSQQWIKLGETISFLLVITFSWFFVFRTSAKRLEQSYRQLEEANLTLEQKVQASVAKNREQEELMVQQSKLAALGEMIGNIAHQWRQPISAVSAIMMNIKWTAIHQGMDTKFLDERMREANEQLKYMSQTIEDFRNFFKPDKEKEPFDLFTACEKAYKILKDNLESKNIKMEIHRAEGITSYGYPNEFSQVILNIISNARDVMFERKVEKPRIDIFLEKDLTNVYCEIKDNGGGISKEIIQKIFDPYFTTKFKARGTGMGLYMSKIIIEKNMEGTLSVSNSDVGAVFTIKLALHPVTGE
ncbi:ATP-binding protein [Sulfurimonas sp. HSL3-7]|uniref:ATP-binding protein n=1 Tax=Sulfonitrofixus jiaomeiensis TaxID=3131938 RepID=UPI0031F7DAA6